MTLRTPKLTVGVWRVVGYDGNGCRRVRVWRLASTCQSRSYPHRPCEYRPGVTEIDPLEAAKEAAWTAWKADNEGRKADAVIAYDELVERFGSLTDPRIESRVVWALVNQSYPLMALGRLDEAVSVCEQALARHERSPSSETLVEAARSFLPKAHAVGKLSGSEDELEVYADQHSRYGDVDNPEVAAQIAWGQLAMGTVLDAIGRRDEALEAYDRAIALAGEAPELDEPVAQALFSKGSVLAAGGEIGEAAATYREVVSAYGDDPDLRLRELAASALLQEADIRGQLDGADAELAVYREVEERFGGDSATAIKVQVAHATVTRAWLLAEVGRVAEALAAYEELVSQVGAETDGRLVGYLSRGLFGRAYELARLGRLEEAIQAYGDLAERMRDETSEEVRNRVIRGLDNKRVDLEMLGRDSEALAVVDDLLGRLHDDAPGSIDERSASLLLRKALLLDRLGRPDEAVEVLETVAELADGEVGGRARLVAAAMLGRSGHHEEALAAYDQILVRDGRGDDPARREVTAGALLDKSAALARLGRWEEAGSCRAELLAAFGHPDPEAVLRPSARREPPSSDEAAAALLSETLQGDCWLTFATRSDDDDARGAMAARALYLFRRTQPLVESGLDSPKGAAGFIVRMVGEGFALLSRRWSGRDRWTLGLPMRSGTETLIREFSLDEWAAEQGHPLELELDDRSFETTRTRLEPASPRDREGAETLVSHCATKLWQFDQAMRLRETEEGLAVLRSAPFRDLACRRIADARRWLSSGLPESSEDQGAVVAIVLIGQGLWIESWSDTAAEEPFPTTDLLAELLDDCGTLRRLEELGIELPDWLERTD
jgi:tetratricopeptide (TPR) repeat protein